jgi:alpha-glucoside transport system permease protein
VGPALVVLSVFLVYPTIVTFKLSFQDRNGENFVGLDNYIDVFTDPGTLEALRNSFLWVLIVPALAVGIGLTFAVLSDKLGSKGEAFSKSFIFMPMAISFVGASIVWRFVYNFRPEGFGEQIGFLNGFWTAIGNEPIAWLLQEPWNNFFLMVILVWLQVGFAMVILSAGIKGVPNEIIEAARIDGASEFKVFWRIIIPSISSTLVVVLTTIVITVWKVFDIVFVMTSGEFGTSVVAERMVTEFFTFGNDGKGAALAVVLLVAVIPLMFLNVSRFKAQEAQR